MKLPQQFIKAAGRYHPELSDEYPEFRDLVAALAGEESGEDARVLAEFLDGLIASNLSGEKLLAVWRSAGGQLGMTPESTRPFLMALRYAIKDSPATFNPYE